MILRLLALLAVLLAAPTPGWADGLTQTALRVPASDEAGNALTLEALLVRPTGPGPFPIAILSHGAPRDAAERPRMAPIRSLAQAKEFARRGWATMVVMRRGYGQSDGPYAESSGDCGNPNYVQSAERGASDIRHAVRFMAQQPFADPSRVLAVGVSAGGLASVALAANPPPGLVAVISFAGGRGSRGDNDVCTPDRLVAAFGQFGRTARAPNLWVYADNDLFFGPALAERFYDAFTKAGGRVRFVQAPANGQDGHYLYSADIPQWTGYVDRFLAERGLTARSTPMALPVPAPPPELSDRCRAQFQDYVTAKENKAFAVAADGAYGWKSGQPNEAQARQGALENCQKHTQKSCRVVILNDTAIR